ncbi:MAG TPA: GNAT family N-acetyltransferase [Candidatus Limnocylindrales bacterium]|jgi:ribosomal protein S18 acetylase RimI-like enzyme
MPLPAGVDVETLIFLERHEARVHARPGRDIRELGDAILLFDPLDREPFWNRVNAIRWPSSAAFDRRLDEVITLFATLDRLPHIWPRPAFNEPPDIVERLIAAGFEDVGGSNLMLLADSRRAVAVAAEPMPRSLSVVQLDALEGAARVDASKQVSLVLAEAFSVPERRESIEVETAAMFDAPGLHACLIRVDGEPAAAAKRSTFDGASYLSSIGTRPAYRGRGLGRLVTAVVTADAIAAGSRWTYLGVFAENASAIRLYEGLGFESLGGPAPDLILR